MTTEGLFEIDILGMFGWIGESMNIISPLAYVIIGSLLAIFLLGRIIKIFRS